MPFREPTVHLSCTTSLNFHFGTSGCEKIKISQFVWSSSTFTQSSVPRVLEFLIWIMELSACSVSFQCERDTQPSALWENFLFSPTREESRSTIHPFMLFSLLPVSTKPVELTADRQNAKSVSHLSQEKKPERVIWGGVRALTTWLALKCSLT